MAIQYSSSFRFNTQEQEGPQGKLKDEIVRTWGSLDTFIGKFNAAAAAVQVSCRGTPERCLYSAESRVA